MCQASKQQQVVYKILEQKEHAEYIKASLKVLLGSFYLTDQNTKAFRLSSCKAQSTQSPSARLAQSDVRKPMLEIQSLLSREKRAHLQLPKGRLKGNCPCLPSESVRSIKSLTQEASQNSESLAVPPLKKKIPLCLSMLNNDLSAYHEAACKCTIKPRGFPAFLRAAAVGVPVNFNCNVYTRLICLVSGMASRGFLFQDNGTSLQQPSFGKHTRKHRCYSGQGSPPPMVGGQHTNKAKINKKPSSKTFLICFSRVYGVCRYCSCC